MAVFGVMGACPQHRFIVLTKRTACAVDFVDYVNYASRNDDPWTRCHCEALLLERLNHPDGDSGPIHMRTASALFPPPWPLPNVLLGFTAEDQQTFDQRWADMQPLAAAGWRVWCSLEPLLGPVTLPEDARELSWLVAGCESGSARRPSKDDWYRSLRDQCVSAGVPFALKQAERGGRVVAWPELDGAQHMDVP